MSSREYIVGSCYTHTHTDECEILSLLIGMFNPVCWCDWVYDMHG